MTSCRDFQSGGSALLIEWGCCCITAQVPFSGGGRAWGGQGECPMLEQSCD